ncbi:MAG: PDZ domain-containing protein [Acidobacteriota bacterium]
MNMAPDLEAFSSSLARIVTETATRTLRVQARGGLGSTGVAWREEGIVVASDRTIEREEGIEVGLPGGETCSADLVGRDPATDVAVLRVPRKLAPIAWSGLDGVMVGHVVLAIARPGRSARALLGIVSARGEAWRTAAGGKIDAYVEPDLRQRPGFSGAVMTDGAGRALGICSAGLARRQLLLLPASTISRVVDAIVTRGSVARGHLGIGAHPVQLPDDVAGVTGQRYALIVVALPADGPARGSGLMLGDTILGLDGQPTEDLAALHELLDEDRVGKTSTLRVLRAGKVIDVAVAVGERPLR